MIRARRRRRPNPRHSTLGPALDVIDTTPSGPAGGDLGGTYPNPTVLNLSHATVGPATYPAGSAANLTNVPKPPTLKSGFETLDALGVVTLPDLTGQTGTVACFAGDSLGVGPLRVKWFGGGTFQIQSVAGAADNGNTVYWISF